MLSLTTRTANWLFMAALLLGTIGWSGYASADGDHDAEPRQIFVAPRTEIRIGDQELVLAYLGGRVVAFLQRYVDGVPTTGASIELTIDFLPSELKEIAPGVYSGDPMPLAGGSNDIDIALAIGEQKETATVTLVVTTTTKAATAIAAPVLVGAVPGFVLVIGALVVFLGVNGLLLWRRAVAPSRHTVVHS